MRVTSLIGGALVALLLPHQSTAKSNKAKDAVQLSNVRALTLHAGKQTSHHRVSAIPQISCVGGNACGLYEVDVMRCKNSGSEYDAEDVQWTCQASLPPEFKLGSTEVVCEGYDGPDDPYILKGSCGVEFRLVLTELGEEKYAAKKSSSSSSYYPPNESKTSRSQNKWTGQDIYRVVFWVVFLSVAAYIAYKIFIDNGARGAQGVRRGRGGGFFGGGGGGGGFPPDDPPPPYSPRPPQQPRAKPSSSRSTNTSSSSGTGSSRPGFWSGAAAGAAGGYGAGYYMGSRTREGESERERERERERAHQREMERERERQRQRERQGGVSMFGPSGGGSSSSPPSSSRYESTGFGGTRRR